jgi:hypothetical protein
MIAILVIGLLLVIAVTVVRNSGNRKAALVRRQARQQARLDAQHQTTREFVDYMGGQEGRKFTRQNIQAARDIRHRVKERA